MNRSSCLRHLSETTKAVPAVPRCSLYGEDGSAPVICLSFRYVVIVTFFISVFFEPERQDNRPNGALCLSCEARWFGSICVLIIKIKDRLLRAVQRLVLHFLNSELGPQSLASSDRGAGQCRFTMGRISVPLTEDLRDSLFEIGPANGLQQKFPNPK